jgi:hypothetical protein
MRTIRISNKAMIFVGGAVAAAMVGSLAGAAFRDSNVDEGTDPNVIVAANTKPPSAFDSWQPTEGAPPPYMPDYAQQVALPPGQSYAQMEAELDRQLKPVRTAEADIPAEPKAYQPLAYQPPAYQPLGYQPPAYQPVADPPPPDVDMAPAPYHPPTDTEAPARDDAPALAELH